MGDRICFHVWLFQILEVSSAATRAEIRSAYKQLSLKYHPDKNRGDRRAAQRFRQLSKAHRALSSTEGRRNYKLYGNPDGPQSWNYGMQCEC